MKYIITPLVGLLLTIISALVAPVGMLFAVWLIRWDTDPTEVVTRWSTGPGDPNDTRMMILGDLPNWLKWFQTPDFRFPCEPDMPEMLHMLDTKGPIITSYIWAGWRNQMMGMAVACGKSTTDYIPEVEGFWSRGDIWMYAKNFGGFRFVTGWQVYKMMTQGFWAVPVFTCKRK